MGNGEGPRQSSIAVAIVACLAVAGLPNSLAAQNREKGPARTGFGRSLPAPGLSVTFYDGAACPPIASPYGSPTRYDGSLRKTGGAEGLHGGIDLTLEEGTALLAVAPGRVFAKGEGGMMEGIFLWLLHLPEDTGLGFPFLTKYQHLREPSPLRVGQAVRLRQEVARAGRTGTVGGHYGSRGYPHLHLTVRVPTDDGVARLVAGDGFRIEEDSLLVDPLTIYVPGLASPAEAALLPEGRKKLTVAHMSAWGEVRPADARAVWPVACP